jgi:hypothetical protein
MKDLSSLSETTDTNQYRIADVALFPVSNQRVLAHAKATEATLLLHESIANLLKQCYDFKTLDEHVDAYCQQQQVSGTMLETLRHKLRHLLQDLAQDGYLISSSQIRQLFQGSGEQLSPPHITSIGFITCNRVEALQRGMISYIEHCQYFGRTHDFVVVDDSKTPTTRDTYREMLRALKTRYGVKIAYAGLEEKMAFAKKLSEAGNIPEDVVHWTCVGDAQYGVTTEGANRNALLLHTVGECIFSADDDIICQVAASPGLRKGLALSSMGTPTEFWFYPDRDSALKSVQFVEQDILALHEQWLGQDPKVSATSYSRDDLLSVEQTTPAFLHRLATRPSTIAITAHGIIGDGSWEKTEVLFFKSGDTFKRLTSSEQAYHSALTSREMAQVVNQVTIAEAASPLITMCVGGLDNRELLPPFPPVGRAEDIAFGLMLTKCFPDTYTVYLPWVLIHAPLEARSYLASTFDIPFYDYMPGCISLFDPRLASTPTDRLYKLGQFLDEIGHLSTDSFAKFTRQQLWQGRGIMASALENQLCSSQDPPPSFWRRDVEAYLEQMRQSSLQPIEQLLRDGSDITQRSLVQFAQILKWWPTMVETAKRLRAEGHRLAQPL